MKIIVAPQAFKGTLSGLTVAKAIAKGIHKVFPHAKVVLIPVADGGNDTLNVLLHAKKGIRKQSRVMGPLGKPIQVTWGAWKEDKTALIETANICGLSLIPKDKRDPSKTTTFGVGELIKIAIDKGYRSFLIGLGGSGTNDGGFGMARALGAKFYGKRNKELAFGPLTLQHLNKIDCSGLDARLKQCSFQIACDVNNPIVGPKGASRVYSAQKGASPQMTHELESALKQYAKVIENDFGVDIRNLPGGGAAGGLGAGMAVFLGAKLYSGSKLILDLLNFDAALSDTDLVITGEGRIDRQTIYDKAPIEVAKRAKRKNIPVIAITGTVGDGFKAVHNYGIQAIFPLFWSANHVIEAPYDKLISTSTEEILRVLYL